MITITISKSYMKKSMQSAIIQAFTSLWEIWFEQMVVILNFNKYKYICKAWLANGQYTQLVFQKAIKVWRMTILLSFSINHEIKKSLSDILNGMIIYLSWFKDWFDANMMNITIFDENSKWPPYTQFYLSESYTSLNNSQFYRFYHICLWNGDFFYYHIYWFWNKFPTVNFFVTQTLCPICSLVPIVFA